MSMTQVGEESSVESNIDLDKSINAILYVVIGALLVIAAIIIPFYSKDYARDAISIISVLATFLVALFAYIAIVMNRQLAQKSLELTNELNRQNLQPMVLPYLEEVVLNVPYWQPNCLELRIENFGRLPARNVKLKFNKVFPASAFHSIKWPMQVALTEISILVPNKPYRIMAFETDWLTHELKEDDMYAVEISYEDPFGNKMISETFPLDLKSYKIYQNTDYED